MLTSAIPRNRNIILVCLILCLSVILFLTPTSYEKKMPRNALQCKGEILSVDNADISQYGIIKKGTQTVSVKIIGGRFDGKILTGNNSLMGWLERDTFFSKGDVALLVLSLDEKGNIIYVNPQSHYRIGSELLLLGLFMVLLAIFGGWTGVRTILSFILSALIIWKILVPLLLKGYDPVPLSLVVVALFCGIILFLVAGLTIKGFVAFCGAVLGILTTCLLSIFFTRHLHIHGAVMPFSEPLLYAGFGHLELTKIYMAAVFIAASGAVMDLAMDVSASMSELTTKKPDMSRKEAFLSGIQIARAVVGTMTTTLLLAYSGGYITLLMAFMAQGIPLVNMFNTVYVAAEVLRTLVGSFGLVTVGPFTALIAALVMTKAPSAKIAPEKSAENV